MSTDQNQILARFDSLKAQVSELQSGAAMTDVASEVSDIVSDLSKLPSEVERVRSRGYQFAAYLERKVEVLARRWDEMRRQVEHAINQEGFQIRPEVERLHARGEKLDFMRAKPIALEQQIGDYETDVRAARARLDAGKARVKVLYATLDNDVEQTVTQVSQIHWYLDQLDEASFKLLAGESLFLAATAEQQAQGRGKETPDGILYLTDQRLIFEQKEKTGKTLGFFGGKMTQEVEWEVPLNLVESVKAENKGLFGGKDMLNFSFKSGAPLEQVTIEVKGGVQSKFWAAQIERMIHTGLNDERAIQPDAETLEAIRTAPTACPVCRATLPALVANQRQIECEYCGTVIRV
ncbi:MAG: hypothetical protein IAE80_23165 [Anaerolinea sp.]|nr:hypothetical protein [Anaerolinea sp.]